MKLSTKVLLFTCVATFVGGATSTELSNTRNLRKKNVSPKKTKSQQTSDQDGNCVLLLRDTQYEDHHETTEVACALEDGTIVEIRDKDASEDFKDKMKKGQFKSGEMEIQGCQFEVDNKGVVECGVPPKKKLSLQARKHNQRKLTTLGSPSVLVVKVIANNGATTSTEATLSNSVFGNNGDPVNLSSQYSACSSNQLNFGEAPDATMTTQSPETGETNISNGAVTVSVDLSTGVGDGTMVNAVLSKLQTNFGVNANNLADYVMVCLPPNTMSGIAYAYLNSYLSVYSDSWCQYVSAQMHEIGHNLGLGHSGEGSLEYGDQSGMMGYSYGYSDAPVMCFNPAKNWQLGWYADKTVTLSISGENFIDVLGGIADYSTSSNKVIVKIIGSGTVDYYIGFNARRGANIGTQEAWDMVTVVTAGRTSTPKSTLVAKLGAGGNYNIGSQASVTVESIDSGSGTASVKICVGPCPTTNTQSPTVSPATAQPTNAPTAPPTATPTTAQPSNTPTAKPTNTPTDQPTNAPTDPPTNAPTEQPTNAPTDPPTNAPTDQPVATPTAPPVATPTVQPTKTPTESPTTAQPTNTPTTKPTVTPTAQPTANPTAAPATDQPTGSPTANPTATPTTDQPTGSPTANPTATPTTDQPTKIPTANPTIAPATAQPTVSPTTAQPTALSVYNYKGFLKPLDLGGIFKSIDDLPFCPNYKGNKLWTVKKGKVRLRIRIRDEANASRLLRVTNDNDLPPPRVVRMFPYEENNIFDLGKAATHGRQLKKQVNLASTIPVGEIMTYKSKNKKDNSQVGVWVYRLNFGKKGSLKAFRKQLRKGCYAIEIEVPLSNDGSSEMVYGDILIT